MRTWKREIWSPGREGNGDQRKTLKRMEAKKTFSGNSASIIKEKPTISWNPISTAKLGRLRPQTEKGTGQRPHSLPVPGRVPHTQVQTITVPPQVKGLGGEGAKKDRADSLQICLIGHKDIYFNNHYSKNV